MTRAWVLVLAQLLVATQASAEGASQDAGATAPPAAAPVPAPSIAATPVAVIPPADADQQMDRGLVHLAALRYADAAATLYGVYSALPLSDSRRDLAGYHLASALVSLGFTQAGVEHYLEILAGRRAPELVEKTLTAIKPLYERRLVAEERFVDDVLYAGQFTALSFDVRDFVEYLQALTDIRHGFAKWGRARLDVLSRSGRPYAFAARYALAVEKIARHEDDVAAADLREIIAAPGELPFEVRNKARVALGRILYEKKQYEEAWAVYRDVDSPLPLQDTVLLERAWDRVASGDQPRALGMVVGLGAPIFHNIFSPERYLIRGLALRRLCQYRAAHLAVREFRSAYAEELSKIKSHAPLNDDAQIRGWAIAGSSSLSERGRIHDVLSRERGRVGSVHAKPLREHLDTVYAAAVAAAKRAIERDLDGATERVADELLRIDEQMSLVDYEIGAGLFKAGGEGKPGPSARSARVPLGSDEVYFKFDGEYWSDELADFAVLAEDRCVR